MNIQAKILDKRIQVECKNKPVTYEISGPEIGKIIDSKIEDNALIVTIKIKRNWIKRIKDLFESGHNGSYEIINEEDRYIFRLVGVKPMKIKKG